MKKRIMMLVLAAFSGIPFMSMAEDDNRNDRRRRYDDRKK